MLRRLTTERAAVAVLFILLFALAARVPNDTDTWWHIRSGEYTLTQGMIHADPFSFTLQGEPWINHSWGAQILLYLAWTIGGNLGLTVFTAGLATFGMVFVYRACEGSPYLRAFAIILGAAAAAVFWSPRPQMLSFALSAVILYLLHLYKRKGVDRLWLIPPLMALWGNLHAGYFIGFILLGGTIAGEILGNLFNRGGEYVIPWRGIRKLVLITLVSVAALLINPYGFDILRVPFLTVSIGALQNYIQEWNSPNFHERQTWPFIALLLAVFGAAGASKRRLDWTDFLLVSVTASLGLVAGRNIALFAVVATPVLTYHLDSVLRERGWVLASPRFATPLQSRLNLVLIALVLLGALAKVAFAVDPKIVAQGQGDVLPVAAADYLLAEQPPGPMFNSYNWGGYLMFRLPDYPVFVDGRTDLYGDTFLPDYLTALTGGDGWRDTLDRYGVNLVVVEAGSGLASQLRDDPDWRLDYEDAQATIFVRASAQEAGDGN